MTSQARYCVIGAGAAGLAALRTLQEQGITADCFEKSDRVGGHWHHDYDALHLITPKKSSGFDGFPMPEAWPVYPSRDQVREYIDSYADHFNLRQQIRFNSSVDRIEPLGNAGSDGWRVTVNGKPHVYAGVLVANGHLWDCAFRRRNRILAAFRCTRASIATLNSCKAKYWLWAAATPVVIWP